MPHPTLTGTLTKRRRVEGTLNRRAPITARARKISRVGGTARKRSKVKGAIKQRAVVTGRLSQGALLRTFLLESLLSSTSNKEATIAKVTPLLAQFSSSTGMDALLFEVKAGSATVLTSSSVRPTTGKRAVVAAALESASFSPDVDMAVIAAVTADADTQSVLDAAMKVQVPLPSSHTSVSLEDANMEKRAKVISEVASDSDVDVEALVRYALSADLGALSQAEATAEARRILDSAPKSSSTEDVDLPLRRLVQATTGALSDDQVHTAARYAVESALNTTSLSTTEMDAILAGTAEAVTTSDRSIDLAIRKPLEATLGSVSEDEVAALTRYLVSSILSTASSFTIDVAARLAVSSQDDTASQVDASLIRFAEGTVSSVVNTDESETVGISSSVSLVKTASTVSVSDAVLKATKGMLSTLTTSSGVQVSSSVRMKMAVDDEGQSQTVVALTTIRSAEASPQSNSTLQAALAATFLVASTVATSSQTSAEVGGKFSTESASTSLSEVAPFLGGAFEMTGESSSNTAAALSSFIANLIVDGPIPTSSTHSTSLSRVLSVISSPSTQSDASGPVVEILKFFDKFSDIIPRNHWPMNEGSGTSVEDVYGPNDGTLESDGSDPLPAWSTVPFPYLDFRNTPTGRVNTGPGPTYTTGDAFTMGLWMRIPDQTGEPPKNMMGIRDGALTGNPLITFRPKQPSRDMALLVRGQDGVRVDTEWTGAGGIWDDNNWHLFICEVSGDQVQIIFDNVVRATNANGPDMRIDVSAQDFPIGCRNVDGVFAQFWDGDISGMFLVDRILTSSEKASLFDTGPPFLGSEFSNFSMSIDDTLESGDGSLERGKGEFGAPVGFVDNTLYHRATTTGPVDSSSRYEQTVHWDYKFNHLDFGIPSDAMIKGVKVTTRAAQDVTSEGGSGNASDAAAKISVDGNPFEGSSGNLWAGGDGQVGETSFDWTDFNTQVDHPSVQIGVDNTIRIEVHQIARRNILQGTREVETWLDNLKIEILWEAPP